MKEIKINQMKEKSKKVLFARATEHAKKTTGSDKIFLPLNKKLDECFITDEDSFQFWYNDSNDSTALVMMSLKKKELIDKGL